MGQKKGKVEKFGGKGKTQELEADTLGMVHQHGSFYSMEETDNETVKCDGEVMQTMLRDGKLAKLVPHDHVTGRAVLEGPAEQTVWMKDPDQTPHPCTVLGAVEINEKGRCKTSIVLDILLDTGQNVAPGGLISETLFYKFTLEKTDLERMKENAIGTADPNSPGLRVLGRVKAGKLAVRLCQHETIFFQPVVVRGLSSGINLGMAFFADRGWIIDAQFHWEIIVELD